MTKPWRLPVLTACAVAAASQLKGLGGGDVWWHVRTGEWIATHAAIPTRDPFSHTAEGPWRYTEWLAQLLLFCAHELGGATGLVALAAILAFMLAAVTARLCDRASDLEGPRGRAPSFPESGLRDTGPTHTGPTHTGPTHTGPTHTGPTDTGPTDTGPTHTGPTHTGPTDTGVPDRASAPGARVSSGAIALAVGLFVAASHAAMAVKPQLFSYLLAAVTLLAAREAMLASPEHRARWLALLVPVHLAWANLHRGGVLGVAFVGAGLVALATCRERRRELPRWALATGLCAAALLANSGGVFYLRSALDLAGRDSFRSLADWRPLDLTLLVERHLALVPLALLFALAVAQHVWDRHRRPAGWRRRALPGAVFEALTVLGTAFLAARSVRFVPFLALALTPGAARAASRAELWLADRFAGRVRPPLWTGLLTALGVAAVAAHYLAVVPPLYRTAGAVRARVPIDAAAYLRANPPPGPMWNSFDLGGYLLYALAPEPKRVFIDGRNDTVYREAFFEATLRAPYDRSVFEAQRAGHDIGFVVHRWQGPRDRSFAFLHADPSWVMVYWDDVAVVTVRATERAQPYLERHGYRHLSPSNAFSAATRIGQLPPAQASAVASDILRNVRQAPHSLRAHYLAALVHRARGESARYQRERAWLAREAARRGVPLALP